MVGEAEAVEPEVVRTVPWSELGADGQEATEPVVQLFRRAGDSWEELPDQAATFDGMIGAQIVTAGDRFVASGFGGLALNGASDGTGPVQPTAFASPDGITWSPLTLPLEGTLTSVGTALGMQHFEQAFFGFGTALVVVNYEGDEAQVSSDGGATWSPVDLAAAGVGGGEFVMGVGGGPLGLALTIGNTAEWDVHTLAVTGDLVDWTTTPIADVFGGDFPEGAGTSAPAVGEDTIALSRSVLDEDGGLPNTITVVGTPTR